MRSGLLWVTHGNDLEWFKMSAKSYFKFARGWGWAKCVVPKQDEEKFKPTCESYGILLHPFEEWPDKGFCHHMAMKCRGDEHFPEADAIFHIDADCVFATEVTPEHWLPGGKALLPFIDFRHLLKTPIQPGEEKSFMGYTGRIVDFNRGQLWWKWAAEFALGFETPRSGMTWMPIVHIPEVYARTRKIIEGRFNQTFDEYVRSCRNDFPQNFCEFEALTGVANQFFSDRYHWHNIHESGYPFGGRVIQCWSRGGFDRPHDFAREVGGHQTPRQLFERLGLL